NSNVNDTPIRITVAPVFPLDARVRAVKVQGRSIKFATKSIGDIQRAEVTVNANQKNIAVVYSYDEGTDVFADQETPAPGAQSKGLRILRSRSDQNALHLVLEGIGGQSYALSVHTPHQLGEVSGARLETGAISAPRLLVAFDGPTDTYVRRELTIPLQRRKR
ncbi:MAG: amylo-alpha-1,6-glucosidase, partial [Gammaproteobacteria bacterium]